MPFHGTLIVIPFLNHDIIIFTFLEVSSSINLLIVETSVKTAYANSVTMWDLWKGQVKLLNLLKPNYEEGLSQRDY